MRGAGALTQALLLAVICFFSFQAQVADAQLSRMRVFVESYVVPHTALYHMLQEHCTDLLSNERNQTLQCQIQSATGTCADSSCC